MGAVDVIIDGVALGGAALHRIGRPPFREVDHGIGALVLGRSSNRWYSWAMSMWTNLIGLPPVSSRLEALVDAHDRRQRLNFVDVDLATVEVVHDQNVVALIRQVHRTGPAAEAVTAENENFHSETSMIEIEKATGRKGSHPKD